MDMDVHDEEMLWRCTHSCIAALRNKTHLLQAVHFLRHYMRMHDLAVYWQCSERRLQERLWEIISHLDTMLKDEVRIIVLFFFFISTSERQSPTDLARWPVQPASLHRIIRQGVALH